MQLDIGDRLVIFGSVVGVIFETVVVLPLEDDIDEKIKLQCILYVCYLWNNVSTTC
jgi:hypothetical protein